MAQPCTSASYQPWRCMTQQAWDRYPKRAPKIDIEWSNSVIRSYRRALRNSHCAGSAGHSLLVRYWAMPVRLCCSNLRTEMMRSAMSDLSSATILGLSRPGLATAVPSAVEPDPHAPPEGSHQPIIQQPHLGLHVACGQTAEDGVHNQAEGS